MEQHLSDYEFFAGDRLLHYRYCPLAYTHVASEGGFDLQSCAAIQPWFQRVEEPDHYIEIAQ